MNVSYSVTGSELLTVQHNMSNTRAAPQNLILNKSDQLFITAVEVWMCSPTHQQAEGI